MGTILNLILTVLVSIPHDKIAKSPDTNSWAAVLAFIVFLAMIYMVLSPDKQRNSKM